MRSALITLFILVSSCSSFAQQSKIDSLLTLLKTSKEDTTKLFALDGLVWQYLYSDIDKAMFYGNQAILLGETSKPRSILGRAHHSMGTVFLQQNKYDSALIHFKIAIKIYEELKLEERMASSYNGIGNIFLYQGVFEKALENYLKALKFLEKNNSPQQKIGFVILNIGIVYYNLENYDKAVYYYNRALKIAEATGNLSGVASAYTNLGNAFKDLEKYEKCRQYFTKAVAIYERIGEDLGLANCFSNLGGLANRENNIKKAMEYYHRAMDLYSNLNHDDGICAIEYNFGAVFFDAKEYSKAIDHIKRSIQIAEKIKAQYRVMEGYGKLHEIYAAMKDDKKAYEALLLYMASKDSVLNQENSKNISRMQTLYETEKKDSEIKLLNIEKEKERSVAEEKSRKQKVVIWSVVGGFLLVVVFAGFIFRSLRITNKQKQIIEIKSRETEQQKAIIQEKNKDITDSINHAKRIQGAMLPHLNDIWTELPQSFVLFKPKDIVSGDFYFFIKNKQSIFIASADCTGHGVPGAFMSTIGSTKLNDAVSASADTSVILSLLNKGFKSALKQSETDETVTRYGMDMDIAICSVDTNTRVVQYAGANRPIWIIRNGQTAVEEIKATKKAIGGFTEDSQHFDSHEIQFEKGDTFYICTDGFADTFGGTEQKRVTTKRFKEILVSIQDKTMKEQEKHLDNFIQDWKGETEQIDDILVFGVRL